ncbi:Asp23/Gls24 family envelope stress response protein [Marinitoga aeolica]|uniref:Asp23/Gls24 family envelope stress response protein n=1 Tax=Marinitoga aeolica TaxID=2809031 RepID=A0ABY8PQA0_9BACT|nr:Asp23/Gls24 family envelope stress response protein [Marinitoga aeolica]WGS64819.1 Asp23/Gls24 family envelope stress response protein [Marinitoga aeolica]
MAINENNQFGELSFSDSALKELAMKSYQLFFKENVPEFELNDKDIAKMIKIVENDDETISVYIKTKAKYGTSIIQFAKDLQEFLKSEVEKMTEVPVRNIDIVLDGLIVSQAEENIEELEKIPEIEEKNTDVEEKKEDEFYDEDNGSVEN